MRAAGDSARQHYTLIWEEPTCLHPNERERYALQPGQVGVEVVQPIVPIGIDAPNERDNLGESPRFGADHRRSPSNTMSQFSLASPHLCGTARVKRVQ